MKKKSRTAGSDHFEYTEFLEEKAQGLGLKTLKVGGSLYVEGRPEDVKKFREQFEEAMANAKKDINCSGIRPVEYKVLVLPEVVEETLEGGVIIKPEIAREKEELAQVRHLVLALGGQAFEGWKNPVPQPGDMVYLAKYSGLRVKGNDGRTYIICNDKDVCGIIDA